jgi:hypothetical protein
MEHAKKLVLVEPRLLEQLQLHGEYKDMQKPTDKKTKADLSVQLQNVLREDDESDDVKAKKYQQMFNRFMKMSSEMPKVTETAINSTTPRQPRQNVRTPRGRRTRSRLNWTQY